MTSTGKGRLYRARRYGNLRGRLAVTDVDPTARTVAGDTWWGGFPPTPTQIPYAWLTPPARWRSDQPRNLAQISRARGGTARSVNTTSVAAVGERPFTASLDSKVVDDPQNYADWIVGNYTAPRQRMPQVRLNLAGRSPTECWRILERRIGDRISITGAPGSAAQLVANPWFDAGVTGWSASGGTATQSSVWSRSGSSSMLLTPNGVSANVYAEDDARAVVPGASYTVTAALFSPLGWSNVGIAVEWLTSSGATDSFSSSNAAIGVRETSLRTATFTAPAAAAYGRVHPVIRSTPSAADLLYADEVTMTGPDGTRKPWPAGLTELVIEGIEHSVDGEGTRWVVWNTAPVIGAVAGAAGPWFRADQSKTDTGSDLLAF